MSECDQEATIQDGLLVEPLLVGSKLTHYRRARRLANESYLLLPSERLSFSPAMASATFRSGYEWSRIWTNTVALRKESPINLDCSELHHERTSPRGQIVVAD